ncbi:MAG: DUF945 family protein [Pseudohongiellaceae bacterium]
MKKIILGISAVVALALVVYLGLVFYVSSQVEVELDNYEAALTQSSEVIVHRFEYERGFRSGQLHYDLEWSPAPDNPLYDLAILAREASDNALRTSGSAVFTQGPWVGGENPLALARVNLAIPVTDSVRRSLPQYPAETPALSISSVIGFDGMVRIVIDGVDYNGTYVGESSTGNIVLLGLGGNIAFNSSLTEVQADIELGQFTALVDDAEILVEGLNLDLQMQGPGPVLDLDFALGEFGFNFDAIELAYNMENLSARAQTEKVEPGVWLGTSTMGLQSLAVEVGDVIAGMQEVEFESLSALNSAGRLEGSSLMTIARINLGDGELANTNLQLSMRNINPQAYADLMQLMSQAGNSASVDDDSLEGLFDGLRDIVNAALVDRPSLHIDRFAVSVVATDDINASLSVSYAGPVPINPDEPEAILNGLALQGELNVSTAAARRLIALTLGNLDDSLSGAELEAAVEENYQQLLTMINDTEFFQITEDLISTSLQVSDGNVILNGTLASTTDELSGFLGGNAGAQPGGMPPAVTPVFTSEARFENLTLNSGFSPDPYTVSVLAVGTSPAFGILGADCFGNVSSTQADVTLNYTAGTDYGLYVYAESDTDTTLVIRSPDGWLCDDDSHGDFDPAVSIDAPQSGEYLIWIGTYDLGATEALLGISEY